MTDRVTGSPSTHQTARWLLPSATTIQECLPREAWERDLFDRHRESCPDSDHRQRRRDHLPPTTPTGGTQNCSAVELSDSRSQPRLADTAEFLRHNQPEPPGDCNLYVNDPGLADLVEFEGDAVHDELLTSYGAGMGSVSTQRWRAAPARNVPWSAESSMSTRLRRGRRWRVGPSSPGRMGAVSTVSASR